MRKIFLFLLSFLSLSCFASDDRIIFQIIAAQLNFNASDIKSADTERQKDGQYIIHLKLRPAAANDLTQITQKYIGKRMVVSVDKKVISTATIQSELSGDLSLGSFSKEEAEKNR